MPKRSKPSSSPSQPEPELRHPTTKRAKQIDADTPYSKLLAALESQDASDDVSGVVAHWFRRDLRIEDNKSLQAASSAARAAKKPLICFWLHCPEEMQWHGLSPARVDFNSETLRGVQRQLKELKIPLCFVAAETRAEIIPKVIDFLRENDVSHVFANFEYEVDELRRDCKLIGSADGAFSLSLHHDQCVMEPGTMTTGSGGPMKVFTPYHKAWLAEVKEDPSLIDTVENPVANDKSVTKSLSALFDAELPSIPENKQFQSKEQQKKIRKLWPPGHEEGLDRLDTFIKKKIESYAETRSNPAKNSTSRLSPYFANGAISMRETLCRIRTHNDNSADFSSTGASPGVAAWVREIVFRELYRQTTATTPHTSMNLPTNLKFEFVEWEKDEEGWKKWCEGRTGVPFVDAGMRQLQAESYMHNRLRMNVSSYLYCNLLIDYRRGERFFAENLVDWDLSNNTQGWEPSYTVFNPTSQAERNDPAGAYIRKWVPELKDVEGKAVFSPHDRLSKAEFKKLGYPEPHVNWNKTKARAMERFKRDMQDAVP